MNYASGLNGLQELSLTFAGGGLKEEAVGRND